MQLTLFLHQVTEHLRVYVMAGTLAAVGLDVARNVSASMGDGPSAAMTGMGMAIVTHETNTAVILAVQGIGLLIAGVGGALYLANIWAGFLTLRQFRFRFAERGPILKLCGWSAAFAYVLTSAVIGVAINAVYLALVG